jgi:hypothetical protein
MLNVQGNFTTGWNIKKLRINPLNAELNPICHLLALLGAHYILHISRIKVNSDYCPKQQQEVNLSNADGLVLSDVETEALFMI